MFLGQSVHSNESSDEIDEFDENHEANNGFPGCQENQLLP